MAASPPSPPQPDGLPREMLWVLVSAPPFLAALFWGTPPPIARNIVDLLRDLAAIWIYTVANGVVIHFVVSWAQRTPLVARGNAAVRTAADMSLVAVVVVVVTAALLPLLVHVTAASRVHPVSISLRALVLGWTYVAVGRAIARLRARAVREALRADAQQRAALAARFAQLQARTNPHFLFNALNTIASLVATDAERAERTIEKLARIFRYALEGSERGTVPLGDEMDAVRDYLDIECTRFGARLVTHIDVTPPAGTVVVLPMLVQPLVENAIVHGLRHTTGVGNVWVTARCVGAEVVVTVEDDGIGPDRSTHKGTGTALSGIRERLALAFGARASLATGARDGGGFRATLRLPAVPS